jgi:hypothetical protein
MISTASVADIASARSDENERGPPLRAALSIRRDSVVAVVTSGD